MHPLDAGCLNIGQRLVQAPLQILETIRQCRKSLFAELDRLGYPGFVGCEYNPRGKTTDGLAWFKPYAGVKP